MKRVLILVLTLALMLGISWCAQAGVYLETMVDGSGDAFAFEADVSAFIIGFDHTFDSFKIGAEYIDGTWEHWLKNNNDVDFNAYELKLGYDFIGGDKTKLFGMVSYFNYEYDDIDVDANGILLGIELNHSFSDSSLLEASIGYSVNGEVNGFKGGSIDADVMLAKLRYTYYFTDNFGLNLGYRYYKVEADNNDFTSNGVTAGISFKF